MKKGFRFLLLTTQLTLPNLIGEHSGFVSYPPPTWDEGKIKLYGNWHSLEWFGLFYRDVENWLWHEKRKWIFVVDDNCGGMYCWVENKKHWLWFSKFKHPYFYNYSDRKWYRERKKWHEYGRSRYR